MPQKENKANSLHFSNIPLTSNTLPALMSSIIYRRKERKHREIRVSPSSQKTQQQGQQAVNRLWSRQRPLRFHMEGLVKSHQVQLVLCAEPTQTDKMQDFRQNTPEGFTRQQVRLKGALQF
jgi:hypothetical protein